MQLQTQRYAVTSAAQHLQNSMSHQSHLSHESAGVGQRLAPYDVFWMVPRFVVVSLFTDKSWKDSERTPTQPASILQSQLSDRGGTLRTLTTFYPSPEANSKKYSEGVLQNPCFLSCRQFGRYKSKVLRAAWLHRWSVRMMHSASG